MGITATNKAILLKNETVTLELSRKDASLLSVVTADGVDITGEKKSFFALTDESWQEFKNEGLDSEGDTLILKTELGEVKIAVTVRDTYFIFEVLTSLPKDAYCLYMGNASYEYDIEDMNGPRAVGVAMTITVDPEYFPDGYDKKTISRTFEHLEGAKGARYGYAVIPEKSRRAELRKLCSEIDPEKGIVMKTAGPWSDENERVQGSYIVTTDCSQEYLDRMLDDIAYLKVDHLDITQNAKKSFRQGDFEYVHYDGHEDFKAKVTDRLAERGIQASLHTYGQYIDPLCHGLLSNPKWQKQLSVRGEYELLQDVSAESDFIPTVESTADLSDYYGFFTKNIPYVLIDEEIIMYKNAPDGFKVAERGACGTTPTEHKKGSTVYLLDGYFYYLVPRHDSELFLEVARKTAENYNKGGYTMIYLDAVDGTKQHCRLEERPYYIAKFTHEIIKHCHDEPILEFADMPASIWASRSRMGAWDMPLRAYKRFINIHHASNKGALRHLYNATLGWMALYPTADYYPGNHFIHYFHRDAIDHLGALSILYNYSIAYGLFNFKVRGWRRNIDRYHFYERLRREKYFSEEIVEKARENPHELAVVDNGKGKYAFVEKNYDRKRLYGIEEEDRREQSFENPFRKQTPFVRIEHCLSTLGRDPLILLPMDENRDVSEQLRSHYLGADFDITKRLTVTVRIKGNGRKGAVGIRLKSGKGNESGYGLLTVDTDFEGWRDFVLCEVDNGDRVELFENNVHMYQIHHFLPNMFRFGFIEVLATGDVEGVRMSDIKACPQIYNVIKNPTLTVGGESVMFECELQSTDFIEWDGKRALVIDRYANEKEIYFSGTLTVPKGKYKASLSAVSLNGCPVNAIVTIGTDGKIIK